MYGLRMARALAPGFFTILLVSNASEAQQAPDLLPPIVVTATRSPLEISRSGSAITIIDSVEIEKSGATGLADVLRNVPGLVMQGTSAIGSTTNATLRGSTPGQTLVLVDGIRVGDPTGTDGALDLGAVAIVDVERIEVLRGPQSALYGSDAMGGVINIITRKGRIGNHASALIEGGSYGTLHARGTVSGATDNLSYAFGVDLLHSDGFARYVDRAQVRAGTWPAIPKSDPTNRVGVSGRISYRLGVGVEIEAGATGNFNRIKIDNTFVLAPSNTYDRFNVSRQWSGSAFVRAKADTLDGQLKNTATAFASAIDRATGLTESCPDFDPNFVLPSSNCTSRYRGARYGAEYQGDLKLGRYGLLIFGVHTETETANTSQDYPANYSGPLFQGISARQTTNSVFALHQFSPADNMDVSIGGRIDSVVGGQTFPTWRATWAYRFPGSGTKIRASAGTGAKNPSLFQRFSEYGNPALSPERNVGYDAGIDQTLFDGRASLSATVFYNKYRDLIDFKFAGCPAANPNGCYFNVNRAVTYGLELSADAILVPDEWKARASYTYMVAKDEMLKTNLLQKPRNKGALSLVYSGIPKLEVEARVTLIGSKFDFGAPPVRLAPYARFDMLANYKLSDGVSIFGRIENIGNAHYQEVFNYAVAGRSLYAGVKASF
jgi:vitamin B12 transporter